MLRNILLTAFSFCLTGCISMSTMESARPLKEGSAATVFGLGYTQLYFDDPFRDDTDDSLSGSIEDIKVPSAEFLIRYGLGHHADIQVKFTSPGFYTLSGKKMLIGETGPFALALGLGISYYGDKYSNKSTETDNNGNTVEVDNSWSFTLIDTYMPLMLSYDIGDNSAIYAAPRMTIRNTRFTSSYDGRDDRQSISMIGGSFGIQLAWFIAEWSITAPVSNADGGFQQVMVGFMGGSDNIERPGSARVESPSRKKSGRKKKVKAVE